MIINVINFFIIGNNVTSFHGGYMVTKKELNVPIRPKEPVYLSPYLAPIDSQLSSRRVSPFSLQILFKDIKSFGFPKRFTASIALVF